MPFLTTITVVGLVVLAGLVWLFMRTRQQDLIADIMAKRKGSSKLVARAEYVEGMQKYPVALSLTDTAIYYQNPDLDASFDLKDIEEVEYDDELATGRSVPAGCRALRLRSHGHTFEFILQPADCTQWMAALPTHRANEPTARSA
ncbi:MAG TPA: hypothetical protein VF381_09620 [Thermoanaerobaculia bacterium]